MEPSQRPQVIKGYELGERIGGGGFGEVYRAYQIQVKREVAIKIILPQYANQPDFIRRFEVEAELVAHLEHPHIVPLYDYWREPDGAYLVMRLLRGGSLKDSLAQGAWKLDRAAKLLQEIASALFIAHRSGIVHRDIKPDNILLDEDGNAYLGDFGIAKDLNVPIGDESALYFTPNYAAPEQLVGDVITPKTDIYNLGLVMYEVLTGQVAYEGTSIIQRINDPIPSAHERRPELPQKIDAILQRATNKNADQRFGSVLEMLDAFQEVVTGETIRLRPEIAADSPTEITTKTDLWQSIKNPYKGLRAFREADAGDFFGREKLTLRLIGQLVAVQDEERFLAVVGPSGSGKSSVVKAGLIPALRKGAVPDSMDWFIVELFPGTNPLAELEAALLRIAVNPPASLMEQLQADTRGLIRAIKRILPTNDSSLLIVIDQFEELFTLVDDEAVRVHFIESLVNAIRDAHTNVYVIITLRADFYDRPLLYESLGELVRKHTEVVLPLSTEELEEAITFPARQVNVTLEPGLVALMARDVGEQPGTLPLLQYALTELFERRQGSTLTLDTYREIGEVTGALAQRAEELFTSLESDMQAACRQLFLRLVTLGEGTENTRRRVRRADVVTDEHVDNVIDLYGRSRLLTFDRDPATRGPTVEVAHEALIRTWDRLREWIADSREDLRIQRRLISALMEWEQFGRDSSYLASGARLTQFEDWSRTTGLMINEAEREYITTSVREQSARKARDEATARRVQNLGRAAAVLGVMIVLAIIATGIFINRASEAQNRVSIAGETLTPIPQTLTPVALTLIAGNQQVATGQVQVQQANALAANAQTQVVQSGQTLTPIPQTLTPAALTVAAGNRQVATAQSQVVAFGATLTPIPETLTPVALTLEAGKQQVAAAQVQVEQANALAANAQTQVVQSGQTLTPIPQTLTPIALTLEAGKQQILDAQQQAAQAEILAGDAQTQVAFSAQTLTPIPGTLTPAALTLAAGNEQVVIAQDQVVAFGATLTPIPQTLTPVALTLAAGNQQVAAAQIQVEQANALADDAQTQVAFSGQTLTPIPLTLTPVALTLIAGNQQVIAAQAQVASFGATLTPIPETLTPVALTLAAGNQQVAAAQIQVEQANALADDAQTQVGFSAQTLTPIPGTLTPAALTLAAGNQQVSTAQAQVVAFGATLTPVPLTLTPIPITLTAIAGTVDAGNHIIAQAQLDLASAQIAVTDARAAVIEAGQTLTPVQATLVAAEATAFRAASVPLAVNAEQAVDNGNYDLALALLLESIRINPDLTQAQRLLNQIVYSGARFSFANAQAAAIERNSRFVVTNSDSAVSVWDMTNIRQEAFRLEGHTGKVNDIELSSNGIYLASAGEDGQILIWDVSAWPAQGHEIVRLGHGAPVNDIAFNSDGTRLLSAGDDNTIILWSIPDGNQIQRYSLNNSRPIERVQFAEGEKSFFAWAAAGSTDQAMSLWNVSGGAVWTEVNLIYDIFDERTTNRYALSNRDNELVVWNAAQQTEVRRFNRGFDWNTERITAKTFDPAAGEVLVAVSGSTENRLLLLDIASGEMVRSFQGSGSERVRALAISPDGNLALSGFDNELVLWNMATGTEIRHLTAHNDLVESVRFSLDGRYGISTARDGNIRVWDIASDDPAEILQFPAQAEIPTINYPGYSPDSQTLYAGVWVDMFAWNAGSAQQLNRILVGGEILNVVYSPKEPYALTIVKNGAILWDMSKSPEESRIRFFGAENDEYTRIAAFSSDGESVLLEGHDLILRERATNRQIQIFSKANLSPGQVITSVAISPDNRYVIATTGQPQIQDAPAGDIIMWDVATGEAIRRFEPQHNRTINSVAISPDGQTVLTGSDDNTLILWDAGTGKLRRRLFGHRDDVNVVLFAPGGDLALSASDDTTIILWDLQSGQPIRRFTGHTHPITGLAIRPDGRGFISSTGVEGDTIRVWGIETPQEVLDWALSNRYIRQLTTEEQNQYDVLPGAVFAPTPVSGNSSSAVETTNTLESVLPTVPPTLSVSTDCANFRLTAPLESLSMGETIFTWDKMEVPGSYWIIITNEAGQSWITRSGDVDTATVDTSPEAIGDGTNFEWEIRVFDEDLAPACESPHFTGTRQ